MPEEQHTDRNSIMEQIYAITNVLHSEYHLCEVLEINQNIVSEEKLKTLKESLTQIRAIRVNLMNELSKKRPAVKGLWCTFKHLFLSIFHLYEVYEKEQNDVYLKTARELMLIVDELLAHDEFSELKDCPRCEDDKEGN